MASNAARFPTILGQNHLYSNKNEYYTISTHDTIPCTMNLSYTTFFYIAAHLVVNAIALPVVEGMHSPTLGRRGKSPLH